MHADLEESILAGIAELFGSGAFTNGPQVGEFEQEFARWCGAAECVGTASGLDALRLGLIAIGIGPGHEVIVPALTFVATLEAVTQAGADPVLVDLRESDYSIDPADVEATITAGTRALLPVHLYGQMADVAALADIAGRYDLVVLEDACQAHGAERDGIRAGTGGVAAAFSFYPAKNLGALGDAGALVTDDGDVAARVRALREHGQRSKYRHDVEGWTSRLDTIQALALLHKLPHLERWNTQRRAAASYYFERLDGVGDLGLPPVAHESEPVWHLFVVRTARPDELAEFLQARGIGSGRHYPQPIHLTGAYRHLGYGAGMFPVAERVAREALSLPIFPGVTEQQLDAVVAAVRDYFDRG